MKILIVDSEPSTLKTVIETLRDKPGMDVRGAISGERALAVADGMGGVDLLLSEVVMEPMDGFALHAKLVEKYPSMQVAFVTDYDLTEYEEYLNGTPVLPKPLHPEQVTEVTEQAAAGLAGAAVPAQPEGHAPHQAPDKDQESKGSNENTRSAKLRSLVQRQGFTGKLDQFQLVDILQMCCLSRRTGRLQISKGVESGVMFLADGNMIHAVAGEREGEEAVYKIISWDFGQFSFEEGLEPDRQTIASAWEHVIMEGVRLRDETGGGDLVQAKKDLVGSTLGPYQVEKKLGEGEWGEVYEAVQTTVDRKVALKVLWKDLGDNPQAVQEFIALASAKANVSHPHILSVYEAGEDQGRYFYASELVEGVNLRDLRAQGRTIDDQNALHLIQTVAEGMLYLNQNKIPHSELLEESIYISQDKRILLSNLATPDQSESITAQEEIRRLSKLVSGAMQGGAAASPGLRAMLTRMLIESSGGFQSFGALLQAVKALQPKVLPADAYKLTEKDRAAIQAVEKAKKRQRRALLLSAVGMFILVWAVLFYLYFNFIRPVAERNFDVVIQIPEGEFQYQGDQQINLPTFYIDKYEVTIGQYAEFLQALEENPTIIYDHSDTPKSREHRPDFWDSYYASATAQFFRDTFQGQPIDLNMPVMYVDWYGAYAYAKWRGGRLPTEQEWEKAARGTEGFRFPWGDDPLFRGVNTGSDYGEKGKRDGFTKWAPVDETPEDKSPYGVMNMAGNVSEWTASRGMSPSYQTEVPVIRGSNYASKSMEITRRVLEPTEIYRSERIGFRVVYDEPPEGAKVLEADPAD